MSRQSPNQSACFACDCVSSHLFFSPVVLGGIPILTHWGAIQMKALKYFHHCVLFSVWSFIKPAFLAPVMCTVTGSQSTGQVYKQESQVGGRGSLSWSLFLCGWSTSFHEAGGCPLVFAWALGGGRPGRGGKCAQIDKRISRKHVSWMSHAG